MPSKSKSSSSRKRKSVLILENYIQDIMLQKYIIYPLIAFKMYEKTNNNTYLFIKQLFTFDRNDLNIVYVKQDSLLAKIILCGLYHQFESFIDLIQLTYHPETNTNKILCYERNIDEFSNKGKAHVNKMHIKYHSELFFNSNKLILSSSNITQMNISSFLFYCLCILSPETRKYIMRYYMLSFLKINNNIQKININIDSTNDANKEIIDTFLVNIGTYKVLPYINTTFVKNDNIKYSFSTCGETTLLNLLNYYLSDKGIKTIDITDSDYSKQLKKFYNKYPTIDSQFDNVLTTTNDWLKVVSNLEGKTNLYNKKGDIHNKLENIVFVLQEILNSSFENIKDLLNDINKDIPLEIVKEDNKEIEFIIDDQLNVFFRPGHGEVSIVQYFDDSEIVESINEDIKDDFHIIFNTIYRNIVFVDDFNEQFGKSIVNVVLDDEEKDKVIIDFLNNIKLLSMRHNPKTAFGSFDYFTNLKVLIFENNNIIDIPSLDKLVNLEVLIIEDNYKLLTIPDLNKLINLKELTLSLHNNIDITNSIYNLKSLEMLHFEGIYQIPRLDNLTNLISLYIGQSAQELPSLDNLMNLATLKIEAPISKLPCLDNLTNLTTLCIEYTDIESIQNLNMLRKLNVLVINYNKFLTELPEFNNLVNLKHLSISENKLIKTIPPLDKLKKLEFKMIRMYQSRRR